MMSEVPSPPPREIQQTVFSRDNLPIPPPAKVLSANSVDNVTGMNNSGPSLSTATPSIPLFNPGKFAQPVSSDNLKKEEESTNLRNSILEYERIMQLQASQLRSDLSYACVLPALLLISIAGKPGLLTLSFGGAATYIMDLLQSVEGSLIALALTFLAFTACVIWGMKDMLTTSILNLLVFLVMGASILLTFLTAICQYNVILFDVGMFNNMMLQVMFASMPLIFSAFIAGVVSVEVPEFDIITVFNICYFIFTYLLCRPRLLWRGGVVQNGFRITRERKAQSKPLLSDDLMRCLLMIPLLISLAVHFAIHRRLPMTESSRWFHFAYAFLLPHFLMSFCVHDHQDLVEDRRTYHIGQDFFQSIVILALGHFLPSHPFFDELKTFCAAEEPMPSRVLSMMGTCIAAAVLLHRRLRELRAKQRGHLLEDNLGMTNTASAATIAFTTRMQFAFFKLMMDVIVALITLFAWFLLNLDVRALPMTIFGGIALNELYHKDDWNLPSLLLLAMVGFLTISVSFTAFADSTIAPLTYVMSGMYDLSLKDFSQVVGGLVTVGALSPALISFLDKSVIQDMLLPQAGTSRQYQGEWIQWAHYLYSIIFVVISLVTIFLELIILDQNWESIDLTTDMVYPSEYAFATAGLFIVTAFLCYRAKIIGLYAIVIVAASNALKMLVFFEIDPVTIYALIFVSLAAMYPFFDQLQLSLQFAEDMDKLEFNAHAYEEAKEQYRTPWQHQATAVLSLAVILFSPLGRHISGVFLNKLLVDTSVAMWQEVTLSAALWVGYLAMVLYVFYPSMEVLRNVCLGISFSLVLLACDAFGILVLDTDSGYLHPMDAAHSFLMRGHGSFYLLLSGILTAATVSQYIALESLFSCVVYSLVFGFVSTKAVIDWAFPLTVRPEYHTQQGGSQYLDLVNGDIYFPFYFLFIVKTLWTLTALYSRRDRANSMIFSLCFYLGLLLPCAALGNEIYQMSRDNDHVLGREIHSSRIVGIIWSTLIGIVSLAFSIRGREILFLIDGGAALANNDNYNKQSKVPLSKRDKTQSWEIMAAKFVKYYYQKPLDAKKYAATLPEHLTPLPGSRGHLSAVAVVVLMGLGWSMLTLSYQATEIDADVLVPAVALALFLTLDAVVLHNRVFAALGLLRPSAVDIWAILAATWWYASLVYHVFVMHYQERHMGVDALLIEMQHRRIMAPYSVFGWDTNVSLWSNASLFVPLLNLGLAMIPLPGLIFALSARLFQIAQEDVLFVLGAVNLAALIGAGVDCVRYLAILSAVLCIYRSYALAAVLDSSSGSSSSSSSSVGAAIASAASTFGGSVGPRLMQRDRYL